MKSGASSSGFNSLTLFVAKGTVGGKVRLWSAALEGFRWIQIQAE
jgi:hypothetical protein